MKYSTKKLIFKQLFKKEISKKIIASLPLFIEEQIASRVDDQITAFVIVY